MFEAGEGPVLAKAGHFQAVSQYWECLVPFSKIRVVRASGDKIVIYLYSAISAAEVHWHNDC
jgi:hypothetical protein